MRPELPLRTPWGLLWGSELGLGTPYAARWWALLAYALCFRAVLLKALLLLLSRLLTVAGSTQNLDTGGAGACTAGLGAGALTAGAGALAVGAERLWLLGLTGLAASPTDGLRSMDKSQLHDTVVACDSCTSSDDCNSRRQRPLDASC